MRARAIWFLFAPLLACDASAGEADGTTHQIPAGWTRVEPAFESQYGVKDALLARDGGCPEGWAAAWVEPNCEDVRAKYCACSDSTKCDATTFACFEVKCACSGIVTTGCKAFRAPFGPALLTRSDAGTLPNAGDSCP
jgi:hypothetical protein